MIGSWFNITLLLIFTVIKSQRGFMGATQVFIQQDLKLSFRDYIKMNGKRDKLRF